MKDDKDNPKTKDKIRTNPKLLASESKYKKYCHAIDKTLGTFESISEWADIIAFLSLLKKSLLAYPQYPLLPRKQQICKRLCQCLNPNLPSGVHLKTLDVLGVVYEKIGGSFGLAANDCLEWLPVCLALFDDGSMVVRRCILGLVTEYWLPAVSRLLATLGDGPEDQSTDEQVYTTVKHIAVSLLASLASGVEEGGTDCHQGTVALFTKLQQILSSPPTITIAGNVMMEACWLAIIEAPKHAATLFHILDTIIMPSASTGNRSSADGNTQNGANNDSNSNNNNKSNDINNPSFLSRHAAVAPLIIKVLAACIKTTSTGSSDGSSTWSVLGCRAALDFICSHCPLTCLFADLGADGNGDGARESDGAGTCVALVMAVLSVLVRGDFSLSRRVYSWLSTGMPNKDPPSDAHTQPTITALHAAIKHTLCNGGGGGDDIVMICKVLVYLNDRGEIIDGLLPLIMIDLMYCCWRAVCSAPPKEDAQKTTFLASVNQFFGIVDLEVAWQCILDGLLLSSAFCGLAGNDLPATSNTQGEDEREISTIRLELLHFIVDNLCVAGEGEMDASTRIIPQTIRAFLRHEQCVDVCGAEGVLSLVNVLLPFCRFEMKGAGDADDSPLIELITLTHDLYTRTATETPTVKITRAYISAHRTLLSSSHPSDEGSAIVKKALETPLMATIITSLQTTIVNSGNGGDELLGFAVIRILALHLLWLREMMAAHRVEKTEARDLIIKPCATAIIASAWQASLQSPRASAAYCKRDISSFVCAIYAHLPAEIDEYLCRVLASAGDSRHTANGDSVYCSVCDLWSACIEDGCGLPLHHSFLPHTTRILLATLLDTDNGTSSDNSHRWMAIKQWLTHTLSTTASSSSGEEARASGLERILDPLLYTLVHSLLNANAQSSNADDANDRADSAINVKSAVFTWSNSLVLLDDHQVKWSLQSLNKLSLLLLPSTNQHRMQDVAQQPAASPRLQQSLKKIFRTLDDAAHIDGCRLWSAILLLCAPFALCTAKPIAASHDAMMAGKGDDSLPFPEPAIIAPSISTRIQALNLANTIIGGCGDRAKNNLWSWWWPSLMHYAHAIILESALCSLHLPLISLIKASSATPSVLNGGVAVVVEDVCALVIAAINAIWANADKDGGCGITGLLLNEWISLFTHQHTLHQDSNSKNAGDGEAAAPSLIIETCKTLIALITTPLPSNQESQCVHAKSEEALAILFTIAFSAYYSNQHNHHDQHNTPQINAATMLLAHTLHTLQNSGSDTGLFVRLLVGAVGNNLFISTLVYQSLLLLDKTNSADSDRDGDVGTVVVDSVLKILVLEGAQNGEEGGESISATFANEIIPYAWQQITKTKTSKNVEKQLWAHQSMYLNLFYSNCSLSSFCRRSLSGFISLFRRFLWILEGGEGGENETIKQVKAILQTMIKDTLATMKILLSSSLPQEGEGAMVATALLECILDAFSLVNITIDESGGGLVERLVDIILTNAIVRRHAITPATLSIWTNPSSHNYSGLRDYSHRGFDVRKFINDHCDDAIVANALAAIFRFMEYMPRLLEIDAHQEKENNSTPTAKTIRYILQSILSQIILPLSRPTLGNNNNTGDSINTLTLINNHALTILCQQAPYLHSLWQHEWWTLWEDANFFANVLVGAQRACVLQMHWSLSGGNGGSIITNIKSINNTPKYGNNFSINAQEILETSIANITQSTHTTLFTTKQSDSLHRALCIRKACFLSLAISPAHGLKNCLPLIQERVVDLLRLPVGDCSHVQVWTWLRVVWVQTGVPGTLWPVLIDELSTLFKAFSTFICGGGDNEDGGEDDHAIMQSSPSNSLKQWPAIIQACKLIDTIQNYPNSNSCKHTALLYLRALLPIFGRIHRRLCGGNALESTRMEEPEISKGWLCPCKVNCAQELEGFFRTLSTSSSLAPWSSDDLCDEASVESWLDSVLWDLCQPIVQA